MGVISQFLKMAFGGNRNVLRETVEVFRENAESGAQRQFEGQMAAINQMQSEFALQQRGWFDRCMDGVNRLPRPALALGTIGLLGSAMVDPVWFAARMQGIALVPEPLWWLLGVIVSFYFGARQQLKSENLQRDLALSLSRVPQVVGNVSQLRQLEAVSVSKATTNGHAEDEIEVVKPEQNPALIQWRLLRNKQSE
ncbi:holin family protein [Parasedimentitalea huanghaiensis]|uniref:Carboxylesterase n=1 Tax=Parasedimentitalea huanghaiensis TaxID=2682100 RepID=A0A6L6WAP9_9RHOB|nr:holin family protein [Zongyanglinia huanghaiensis]MVO14660.1 carboxylesterase [Zongyanglinia huanghaiensis]